MLEKDSPVTFGELMGKEGQAGAAGWVDRTSALGRIFKRLWALMEAARPDEGAGQGGAGRAPVLGPAPSQPEVLRSQRLLYPLGYPPRKVPAWAS